MSTMEPGSPPPEGPQDPRGNQLPARNMADIARLFLEGARPLPARTPPAWRTLPPNPENHPADRPRPASRRAELPPATSVLGLASAGLEAAPWRLLVKAAQGLAEEQSTTAAVVGLVAKGGRMSLVMDMVGVESADELPAMHTVHEPGGATSDVHIARALHRLRPVIGLWIVAAPPPAARVFPAIGSIVHEWLLVCPTDNNALIAAYQHLKHAWMAAAKDHPISPKVYLLSEDYAQAAVVHKRLRNAAREFLGTDLALAGAGPIRQGVNGGGGAEPIRILNIACQGPEDALWAAILDELCPMPEPEETIRAATVRERGQSATGNQMQPGPAATADIEAALDRVAGQAEQVEKHSRATSEYVLDHLAQVLDPEERAALAADLEEPGVAVARPRGRDVPPPPPEKTLPLEEKPAPIIIKQTASPQAAPQHPQVRAATVRERLPGSPAASPAVENAARPADTELAKSMPAVPLPAEGHGRCADRDSPLLTPPQRGAFEAASTAHEPPDAGEPVGPLPLQVFDLEDGADRTTLWQAVERSIWNLSPRSALLDAKPPMSWATDTCLAIDAAGRVNVWTLYRDGTSWFALREWAHEHRNLLALTRRDLVVDKEADVVVHIVLPLDHVAGDTDVVPTLLRIAARNIYLYRLRQIQWNSRRGLLVVPIS